MQSRIMNFFVEKNALFEMQYGVQQGRSWEHALLNAQNTSLDSLNRRQISILLLVDFSKAFNMAEHSILFKKLEHCGMRGFALKWLESYHTNATGNNM